MNYFELFGLPVAPAIDKSMLPKKYFELQKQYHPDFYTQGSETEKEDALEQSAAINKAFKIFQQEQKTIEYFLETIGLIVPNEKFKLPPDFLMEMMEINEAISEEPKDAVIKKVEAYETELWENVKPVVINYEAGKTEQAGLLRLKEYYYKKKYLERILDRLSD